MEKTKICVKCKKRKPRKSYYLRNKKKGWIFSECIPCSNKLRKLRMEKRLGRKLKKRSRLYSTKEIVMLKRLYLSGMPYVDMKKKFKDRTRHALESKLSELGIASRRSYMLRRETGIERTVKQWIEDLNYKFKFQVSIGRMSVDFCKNKTVNRGVRILLALRY